MSCAEFSACGVQKRRPQLLCVGSRACDRSRKPRTTPNFREGSCRASLGLIRDMMRRRFHRTDISLWEVAKGYSNDARSPKHDHIAKP